MTTPFITVSKGGPENDIDDGVYLLTLTAISDPRTVTARQGPKAGQDIDLLDWTFATEEGLQIEASTSTASGPRSKMYAYLTALFGGKAPPVGTQINKEHLIGRQAFGTIQHDDAGWPRIVNLGAVPNTLPLPVKPTSTEAVVTPKPARQAGAPVAQSGADLPF